MALFLMSCEAFKPKKVDTRNVPTNAQERAVKNIEEGSDQRRGTRQFGQPMHMFVIFPRGARHC